MSSLPLLPPPDPVIQPGGLLPNVTIMLPCRLLEILPVKVAFGTVLPHALAVKIYPQNIFATQNKKETDALAPALFK